MHRVWTEWNDNFYFLSFAAFSCLFWLEMKPRWYFFNFFNFLAICLEFSITQRVGTKRTDSFHFLTFPAFSNLFWLVMKPQWYFLIFWIFFYFFGIFYYSSGRKETEQYFLFSLFLSLFQPILAWNEAVMVLF